MIIDNVKVYTPDQKFVEGGLVLDQDRIEAVYTNETKPDLSGKEVLDGEGAYAIPGLIDLHFHGAAHYLSDTLADHLFVGMLYEKLISIIRIIHVADGSPRFAYQKLAPTQPLG